MDKVLTTWGADGQPILSPTTLDHIQGAYSNVFNQTMRSIIGTTYSTSIPYVLSGCVSTTGGGGVTISEGMIFFNGEVFYSPQQFVVSGIGVLLANIGLSYPTTPGVEPVLYKNGATHFTHQFRRVSYTIGTSGTGTISDYTAFVQVLRPIEYEVDGSSFATYTVALDRNKFIYLSNGAGPSTISITFDMTLASQGCEVILHIPAISAGDVLSFPSGGVRVTGSLTIANSTTCTIKLRCVDRSNAARTLIEIYNPA